jgi:cell division protein FtsB
MTQKQPRLNMKKIIRWAAAAAVILGMGFLFLGKNSILHIYSSYANPKKTEKEIQRVRAEIDSLALESKRLKNDTAYIEKIAREKLGMAGKKEKVFKFIEGK